MALDQYFNAFKELFPERTRKSKGVKRLQRSVKSLKELAFETGQLNKDKSEAAKKKGVAKKKKLDNFKRKGLN